MMEFKGVMFDNFHSFRDFSLVLSKKEKSTPKVKTYTTKVDGMDGVLDLTDFFGEPKYDNRKLTYEFTALDVLYKDFDNVFSKIQNAIHGKHMKIVEDTDNSFYWIGRVTVNKWKSDKNIGKVTIDCDVEPYKYKKYKTIVTEQINGTREMILLNLRKSVVPIFKSTGDFSITFENKEYRISSGEYTLDDVVFKQGKNAVTVQGNGVLTIEYQERGL